MDIVINPGSGFGTGEHLSTQAVLTMMSRIEMPQKVLDVGCGSGILSIAAVRLGASRVVACDIDPLAVSNAKENLKLNGVKGIYLILGTPSCIGERFPLVMANIDFFTLTTLREELARLTEDGGTLLLSGILREDEETVVQLYRQVGFTLKKAINIGDWSGLHLERSGIKGS